MSERYWADKQHPKPWEAASGRFECTASARRGRLRDGRSSGLAEARGGQVLLTQRGEVDVELRVVCLGLDAEFVRAVLAEPSYAVISRLNRGYAAGSIEVIDLLTAVTGDRWTDWRAAREDGQRWLDTHRTPQPAAEPTVPERQHRPARPFFHPGQEDGKNEHVFFSAQPEATFCHRRCGCRLS
ncbi:hypothetical protein JIX56_04080 [Streptomyces sp. CA-210063]|uniref:hypothetical protein n=1 Tax=Streptomyces sp. CA-210063 TaxID=2801029 RepID=UPI00214CCB39|nr:hypothetical protein [Streptomyces sp. CA-210063]UUU29144.1 hypothetical protein JIX56_04080 [Streptomyces sp. CA-210063]